MAISSLALPETAVERGIAARVIDTLRKDPEVKIVSVMARSLRGSPALDEIWDDIEIRIAPTKEARRQEGTLLEAQQELINMKGKSRDIVLSTSKKRSYHQIILNKRIAAGSTRIEQRVDVLFYRKPSHARAALPMNEDAERVDV